MRFNNDTMFGMLVVVALMMLVDPLAQWIEVNMVGGTAFENFVLNYWVLIWVILLMGSSYVMLRESLS